MRDAADYMAQSILGTADSVRGVGAGVSGIGVDEIIFWPTVPDLDQLELLAEIVS